MALAQGKVLKASFVMAGLATRRLSSGTDHVKKYVFISQSNDVYTNLALENWLYKNYDFSDRHILLLTHNDPCVLIGNNQNPWVESNVHQLKNISKKGTRLARRIGEGPAVYQDEGNLNLTFFTKKNSFNTGYNMEVVKRALFRQFNLKTKLTSGKDIMLRTKKVFFALRCVIRVEVLIVHLSSRR